MKLLTSILLCISASLVFQQNLKQSPHAAAAPGASIPSTAPTLSTESEQAFAAQMREFYASGTFFQTAEAAKVDPENPLPEYPKPQFQRQHWQNLNGIWQIENATNPVAPPAFGQALEKHAVVPFCVEAPLSGIGATSQLLSYRKVFQVAEEPPFNDSRVLLHIERADHYGLVYMNQVKIGSHKGGYASASYDVTDAMEKGPDNDLTGQDNELFINVVDQSENGMQPLGKQRADPTNNILYTSCSGIWGTVWLEFVPSEYATAVVIVPDIDNSEVLVTVSASEAAQNQQASFAVYDGTTQIATQNGPIGQQMTIKLPNAKLWSPDDPFLYTASLTISGSEDFVETYFGMRKIHLADDSKGTPRLWLNNEPIFQWGLLDQGYIPEGIYTYPTEEAMRFDLEHQKTQLGANMVRKHMKVESDRWYHMTDTLGLLVWQDIPAMCGLDSDAGKGSDTGSPPKLGCWTSARQISEANGTLFKQEMKEIIDQHVAFPSVVQFSIFNEAWGEFEGANTTEYAISLDPAAAAGMTANRHFLYTVASGWQDHPAGDIYDKHCYDSSLEQTESSFNPKDSTRANVLGEHGGIACYVDGHSFAAEQETDVDEDAFASAVLERLEWVQTMAAGYLNAAVFTQLTDVEKELNGMITYDRAVSKLSSENITAVAAAVQTLQSSLGSLAQAAAPAKAAQG